jgi:hypothetical protein
MLSIQRVYNRFGYTQLYTECSPSIRAAHFSVDAVELFVSRVATRIVGDDKTNERKHSSRIPY